MHVCVHDVLCLGFEVQGLGSMSVGFRVQGLGRGPAVRSSVRGEGKREGGTDGRRKGGRGGGERREGATGQVMKRIRQYIRYQTDGYVTFVTM